MRAEISPSTAYGDITAPPSKSISHRMIICAALAGLSQDSRMTAPRHGYDSSKKQFVCGDSVISNIEMSDDISATAGCIEPLYDLFQGKGDVCFKCNESGSTLRFFIPVALVTGEEAVFTGKKYLLKRPLSVYEDICREKGLTFIREDNCIRVKGPLKPGTYTVPGNISSQFISGLMFALPLLPEDSIINITGNVESMPYIDMTADALSGFGINTEWKDDHTLKIPGNRKYTPGHFTAEGDYSNAAFLDAFNLIGGNVNVSGLKEDSLQGDRIYKEYFRKLAAPGAVLDISDCPDLGPVLIALSAMLHGAELTGTARLKIKESDRGTVMQKELRKLGVRITVEDDRILIPETGLHYPEEPLDPHNDHRIAMALSLILSVTGGTIENAESVNKSFPAFFDALKTLHINVDLK